MVTDAGVEAATETAVVADHPAVARLRERFGDQIIAMVTFRGETTILVERESVVEVCAFLRQDPELRFNFLSAVQCCDWLGHEPRFEVVYHLLSMERRDRLRIKVGVPETDLTVPTMTTVWSTANWFEREIFDMFGITFVGHPDLRRILMPDDWEGHPLRRDEPIGGEEVAFTS
ncbi:MAG TPA: NADH-quinone oxidoreductase subunit C [Chloroflexota bacterium]|nr:NADH-quinone oxidoreductase subunit C [Chloroflexota bacterium]